MGKTTVECLICHKALDVINNKHTLTHGLLYAEYREMYPEADVGKRRTSDSHYDTDVQCSVCGRWMAQMTLSHLATHNGMTAETYVKLFPEPEVKTFQPTGRLPTASEAIHMVCRHPVKSMVPTTMVRCMICDLDMRVLTNHHLRHIHGIDMEIYKKTYPNARTAPVVQTHLTLDEALQRKKEAKARYAVRLATRKKAMREQAAAAAMVKPKPVLGWHKKMVEAKEKATTETPAVKQLQTKVTSYSGVYASSKTRSWERFSSKTELARFFQLDADPETLWWSGHYPVHIKGLNCVDSYAKHCINVVMKNGTIRIEDVRDHVGNEGVQSILDVKKWCGQNLVHYLLLLSTQVQPDRVEIEREIDTAYEQDRIKFDAAEPKVTT